MLIFINSHPIQYFAPFYSYLNNNSKLDFSVWYLSRHGLKGEKDRQFNTSVKWDIDILDGYKYQFLKNQALKPSIYSFWGIFNLSLFSAIRRLPNSSLIVIHGWNYASTFLAIIFALLFKHKLAISAETPLNHEILRSGIFYKLRKLFLKTFIFNNIDYCFYIGQQNKQLYQYYGINENKLIFQPYSIDNVRFTESYEALKNSKSELRKRQNIPNDSFVFLTSGKYIQKKNPLDVLKAFLRINNPNLYLVMIGEGELRQQMEAFCKNNNLNNVLLTGFVNQNKIAEYYALADTYIMASGVGETWGLSTNEAMNFKLPLLISNLTGCSLDLVIEDRNGNVFETGNIEQLAKFMNVYSKKTKDELDAFGTSSINLIQQYSFTVKSQNLDKLL